MPDHILVTVWENTDYSSLIGNSAQAPYLNGLLSQGVLFTNYHAVDHPSEGNYIAMFSGGDQGMTTDNCPQSTGAENVFHLLASAGKTYLGYMEDLPSVGFTGCTSANYVRRHNASIQMTNVAASTSVPWTQFPSDYTALPALSVVIPNLMHDLHDGSMAQADAWLQTNLDAYIQWAKTHNSLFIFTLDESATGGGASQVPLLIVGQGVTANTTNAVSYDHTNLSSTLSGLLGLPLLPPPEITGWYSPSPRNTIGQDTLQRADVAASSWGVATDGHPWAIVLQTVGTAQVSNHAAQVSNSNNNGINLLLGSMSRTDTEVLMQTSLSDPTAATHPILRYVSQGNYYYAGQDLGNLLAIKARINDVGTTLVNISNTLTANQKYWIRFNVTGSTLSLRFWQDGNAEPSTWNLQTTDTTFAAGAVGYRGTCHTASDTISVYSYQVTDTALVPAIQLIQDTFHRANQSGFGTSSDGDPWTQKDAAAILSIVSNQGNATTFSTGASTNVILGGIVMYDADMRVRFSTSAPATDGVFFIARYVGNTNLYYIGVIANQLVVRKLVANVSTTIQSVSFTMTANSKYWLHAIVQGTTLQIKAWLDGNSEPGSWTITTTDSAFTQGNVGLRLFGALNDTVLVDNMTVNSIVTTPTRTLPMAAALTRLAPGVSVLSDALLNVATPADIV